MLTKSNKPTVNEQLQEFTSENLDEISTSNQKGLNIRPYIRLLWRKAWLILGLTAIGTGAAAYWSYSDSSTYVGNFYLLVEPITPFSKVTDPSAIARTGGRPDDSLFRLDYPTNLAFLQSPGMTLRLAKGVHEKQPVKTVPAIWNDLRNNFTVERVGKTQSTSTKIFTVSYRGENPTEVQTVLEVAAETFLQYSKKDRETSLKAGIKFIDTQLPEIQQRLKKLQTEQQKLRQQYELIDPTAKGQEVLGQVNNLEQQLLEVENQLKVQLSLDKVLRQQLDFTPEEALAAAALTQDPTRSALIGQLQQIETQIAVESSRFTFESPTLENLQEQKQNILKLLNEKTEQIVSKNSIVLPNNSRVLNYQDPTRLQLINQLVGTTNQIQQLRVQYQSLQEAKGQREQQAKRYPELIRRYQQLEREIALTSGVLDRLLTQRETLKVESAQELPWQLISPPQIPQDKDGQPIAEPPSRKKKLLIGFMGGLVLGAGLALLLEKRKNVFYTELDLQDAFSVPMLGNIPWDDIPEDSLTLTKNSLTNELENKLEFEADIQPQSVFSVNERGVIFLNAFDFLFSELSFIYSNPPIHSLVVSSVQAQDGQSTVAIYLARAAAATGKRVLLVDTNLSNPQLHSWFNLPNYKGLSDLLTDNELASYDVIQRSQEIENLFLLSAGSTHSSSAKLLWFPRMRSLMREFKVRYDLIIYDAPHYYESTDIGFLGGQTDGILMVVGVNKTPQSLVKKAITEMNKLRLPLLGTVTNHPSRK